MKTEIDIVGEESPVAKLADRITDMVTPIIDREINAAIESGELDGVDWSGYPIDGREPDYRSALDGVIPFEELTGLIWTRLEEIAKGKCRLIRPDTI